MEQANKKEVKTANCITCFFYTKLIVCEAKGVRKWIKVEYSCIIINWPGVIFAGLCIKKQDDVFTYKRMIIPANTGGHWYMAVADFTNREMRWYDSWKGDNINSLEKIR